MLAPHFMADKILLATYFYGQYPCYLHILWQEKYFLLEIELVVLEFYGHQIFMAREFYASTTYGC